MVVGFDTLTGALPVVVPPEPPVGVVLAHVLVLSGPNPITPKYTGNSPRTVMKTI
jgi:hypothetical protein